MDRDCHPSELAFQYLSGFLHFHLKYILLHFQKLPVNLVLGFRCRPSPVCFPWVWAYSEGSFLVKFWGAAPSSVQLQYPLTEALGQTDTYPAEPQPPAPDDGPSLPPQRPLCGSGGGGKVSRLGAGRRPGLGAGVEGGVPTPGRQEVHHGTSWRAPATPCGLHGLPGTAAFKMAAAATRPVLPPGASREGGRHGQATVTPRRPGAQRGAGGAGRGGRGGWGAGAEPERGRERNKRSLCGAGQGEERAHYPMPRSHVGNKRTILCLAWKTTWSRERQGEI